MKKIKTTHIDTGGHGYLSVSKKDFLEVLSPDKISKYSGHTPSRIYLEEDQDATVFMNAAEAKGIKVEVKSGYNLGFKIHHNYDPALFNFKPVVGAEVKLTDDMWYTIIGENDSQILVSNMFHRYGVRKSNPFEYITAAK